MNPSVNIYVDENNSVLHVYCARCAQTSIEEIEFVEVADKSECCEECGLRN